jgi:hypothetical protein
VSGHDFSRAANASFSAWASAPAIRSSRIHPKPRPFSAACLAPADLVLQIPTASTPFFCSHYIPPGKTPSCGLPGIYPWQTLETEGAGGFNPRTRPTTSPAALAADVRFSSRPPKPPEILSSHALQPLSAARPLPANLIASNQSLAHQHP